MLKSSKKEPQQSLFFSLEDSLNQKHPLYMLSNRVDWDMLETSFRPLYCQDNGTPAKPIRLMVGLLILKHVRNVSDESIVEQWSESLYCQYFYGQQDFLPSQPCASSELVHFRHRIGEWGCELILKESIRINGGSNHLGNAWKHSGQVVSEFAGCAQLPIYQDSHNRLTIGLDPIGIGVSANYAYKDGDYTFNASAGIGLGGPYASAGTSYSMGDLTLSAGAGVGNNYVGWTGSATYNGYGLGYGQTYYGNAPGPDNLSNAQTVGGITAFWKGGSFRIENDVFLPKSIRNDRWRTNAWELSFDDFSFGSYIYTNDGQAASEAIYGENDAIDLDAKSPIWKKNPHQGLGAWKDGRVYSAPMWFGYRVGNNISRIGYSFRGSQDLQQNGIHTTGFGKQNFYLNYQNFRTGMYVNVDAGNYSPFSLWGY